MGRLDSWEEESAYRRILFQAALLGDQEAQLELEREFHVRISSGTKVESPECEASHHE
ncbi:hypothetical protein W02_22420 [Nitrospira sp. KM1]|uniref:hypothetical protein n=1 Tax=Nitrospira sp. KM1 TaxID=1936990 RepID=UPI0013A773BA|nr:hypothetical protein [Nitrospira sp. KM1]BCA55102.1 hypothetical protein W02_22420 [Nitrospira sp. KM1]